MIVQLPTMRTGRPFTRGKEGKLVGLEERRRRTRLVTSVLIRGIPGHAVCPPTNPAAYLDGTRNGVYVDYVLKPQWHNSLDIFDLFAMSL